MSRIAAVTTCLVGAGCSFLLDTAEPIQCTTDADCEASPLLRGRTCDQGFCVVPTAERPPEITEDAGSGCVSSELCTQANSNKASVCRKAGEPCVPWQTEQCGYISGAWSDPNAIVIGDIQPFTVRQVDGSREPIAYADRVRRAIDLGLSELSAELPGGVLFPDGKRRPFAVLHCDSGLSPEGARAAVRHLTEVVGTQALIIGADEDLAAVTPELTESKVAIACSDCIGPFPPGPLAWRILPRLALEAPMAAWRVSRLEEELQAGPSPPSAIKVGVLLTPGRATDAFVSALTEKLRFNGKSAVDNKDDFMIVRTENPTETSVDHVKHADAIVAFGPDILVVATAADFPTYYLPLIEEKWPAGKRRPFYVTTNLNFQLTPFAAAIADDDVRRRISGTRPGYSQALQDNIDGFRRRYLQAYNFQQPDESHSGYDAFYTLAYAILAARVQPPLDGPRISAGFERLRGGSTPTDYRPDKIAFAVALLGQQTARLDVRGLWSDLEWDFTSRDMDADVSMYCFERDGDGNLVLQPNAGPHLTTSTGVVTGVYSCD